MNRAAELLLLAICDAAQRARTGLDTDAAAIRDGRIGTDIAQRWVDRVTAAAELAALVELAERYIVDCPELGLTTDMRDLALHAADPADLAIGLTTAAHSDVAE